MRKTAGDAVKERLYQYALLMRLHKPIGILLLLWPTLWALWLAAGGVPDLQVLAVFVAGVVLMRSAGCVINDYADRHIDPHVRRTRERPIAAGKVSPREALLLFAVLCLLAFGLVLLLNRLTILLSFVAVALAAIYPFTKRVTNLPQLVLGTAFGWAVPMAYAAQTGAVPAIAWLLLLANVLWSTAYDSYYAMVDREDDLRIGVKSTAILFGRYDLVIIAALQGAVLVLLLIIGRYYGLGIFYYLGLACAAGFAVYQAIITRTRDTARCFQAFLNNNWLGMAIFAGIAIDFALQ